MDQPVREVAVGRWPAILVGFGLSMRFLSGKHAPCPLCGGKDRFRFDNKEGRGTYHCSQCGPGDGFSLLLKWSKQPFATIADQIRKIVGDSSLQPVIPPAPDPNQQLDAIRRVWKRSRTPESNGPVDLYVRSRLRHSWPLVGVREHPAARREAGGSGYPAMIWPIQTHAGDLVNLHITLLTPAGEKAPVEKSKLYMPGSLPSGAAVRLCPAGEVMGIAEGIETAMAASLMHDDMPVWAATNANLLTKWEPPEITTKVVVFADNDANYTGQSAAYQLANRLVTQRKIAVEVIVPRETGKDFADVLRLA